MTDKFKLKTKDEVDRQKADEETRRLEIALLQKWVRKYPKEVEKELYNYQKEQRNLRSQAA